MDLKKKGQSSADIAMGIATMAIVLVVVVIVLGQITDSLNVGLSGAALAAYGNVTGYAWVGIQLAAIGIIIVAGMGLISMMIGRQGY